MFLQQSCLIFWHLSAWESWKPLTLKGFKYFMTPVLQVRHLLWLPLGASDFLMFILWHFKDLNISISFFLFLLFVWSLLVICREVSLCLSDELPWDWETWSLWSCTHRWAGGAGSPPPGEGAACPQKEQARWCGYTGMRELAVPCPTAPCWRSVCHLSLQSLEGGKKGREAENMNRSCTSLSQGQIGVCSHNCP